MKGLVFSLKSLSSPVAPGVKITGEVARESDRLSVRFVLSGPLSWLSVPSKAATPLRKYALWEETCFELFVGPKGVDYYWEFNLSPSGHWNVFRFESYRQGMQEEQVFSGLPFEFRLGPEALRISLKVALDKIIPPTQALQIAVSAVLKGVDHSTTYWALTHPAAVADFHRRDSFLLEIGPTTP